MKNRYGTKNIILSLGLITKTVKDAKANEFIEKNGIEYNEFKKYYIKLYNEALNRGFLMNDIFSFDGMCTAKLKNGFLLEPNGYITKCVSGVGREEFRIGDYVDNKLSSDNYLYKDLYIKCLDENCPFLPICHTGCRFSSYIETGNKHARSCKRKLLEEINDELIDINYK